jgi:hypothetical protein
MTNAGFTAYPMVAQDPVAEGAIRRDWTGYHRTSAGARVARRTGPATLRAPVVPENISAAHCPWRYIVRPARGPHSSGRPLSSRPTASVDPSLDSQAYCFIMYARRKRMDLSHAFPFPTGISQSMSMPAERPRLEES